MRTTKPPHKKAVPSSPLPHPFALPVRFPLRRWLGLLLQGVLTLCWQHQAVCCWLIGQLSCHLSQGRASCAGLDAAWQAVDRAEKPTCSCVGDAMIAQNCLQLNLLHRHLTVGQAPMQPQCLECSNMRCMPRAEPTPLCCCCLCCGLLL